MSKVSRSVLKSLVKECLVEILAEGLVGANKNIQESKKRSASKASLKPKKKTIQERNTLDEIPQTIKNVTNDPLMQSIFADTAKTTLVEQVAADNRQRVVAGDPVSQHVDKSDPMELFGESASNWATLAFSEKKQPGQHK